jgi:hypothetical protein
MILFMNCEIKVKSVGAQTPVVTDTKGNINIFSYQTTNNGMDYLIYYKYNQGMLAINLTKDKLEVERLRLEIERLKIQLRK